MSTDLAFPSAADFQFTDEHRFFDLFGQIFTDFYNHFFLFVCLGVKGVYKNFCIYIVRKR